MRLGATDGDHVAFPSAALRLLRLLGYDFTEGTGGTERGLRLV